MGDHLVIWFSGLRLRVLALGLRLGIKLYTREGHCP